MFSATSTEQLDALEFSQHPALVRSSVLQLLSSYVRALTHRIHTWLNRSRYQCYSLLSGSLMKQLQASFSFFLSDCCQKSGKCQVWLCSPRGSPRSCLQTQFTAGSGTDLAAALCERKKEQTSIAEVLWAWEEVTRKRTCDNSGCRGRLGLPTKITSCCLYLLYMWEQGSVHVLCTQPRLHRGDRDYHQFPFRVETIPEIPLLASLHKYLLNVWVNSF